MNGHSLVGKRNPLPGLHPLVAEAALPASRAHSGLKKARDPVDGDPHLPDWCNYPWSERRFHRTCELASEGLVKF